MTNQSIWAGNSPRLCLLLGTFHTVTLQSDSVLCLLYIGKGIFSLELAQGTVWNRGKVYTPIFNKLYTYQKGITGYEVYLNRIPTSLTTLKDKSFIALLANKYPWYFLLQKAEHTVKKILTQKKKPKKGGKVCKFLKDFFFFLRKSLPGLSCQATLLAFLPHTVCFPTTPCQRHRKTKKTPIFMWSLERCKSFWFVEERQGKENANNLQLWQKVPQKQLNNFPVTLETEFTPQQTGKLPAITTSE